MAPSGPVSLHRSRAPKLAEARSWIGWRVDDLNGSPIGEVADVLCDEGRQPAWLILAGFQLGDDRRFLVPAYDAVGGDGRVWSPHLRSQVRGSAELVAGLLTSEVEGRLRAYYAAPSRRRAA